MTKKQLAITIIALAAIIGTGWGWREWLEYKKAVQIEELKSKEHLSALEKLSFAGHDHAQIMKRLVDVLEQQGQFGKKALDAINTTNDGLLKAIEKEGPAKINGVDVDQNAAELLRTPARKRLDQVPVTKMVKVVSINTADLLDLQFVLQDVDDKTEYKVRLKDNLLAGLDRHQLFQSLENRTTFSAELSIRESNGEIRSVEFLRIAPPRRKTDAQSQN